MQKSQSNNQKFPEALLLGGVGLQGTAVGTGSPRVSSSDSQRDGQCVNGEGSGNADNDDKYGKFQFLQENEEKEIEET
ncbi:Hypothetical protein CINCED_3A021448 [Cinara cedri]|uniref:Uncharacterized protein n=1 Tax=Cinara cedri TaxID=506608 RepID=A0A5E4N3T2_9HEMI|nr:Hypothetical protein CINCED_3A021448 [Cinara cedri]